MEEIAARLLEEMTIKTAFTIPVLGGLPVSESVVMTWCIAAVLLVICLTLTWGMKVENPGRRQLAAEAIVEWLNRFIGDMVGEEGKRYVPYLQSVLVLLAVSNVTGIFGLRPPTRDLNVTAALALMSIILIEYSAIRHKGLKGWMKSFAQPVAIITPINILEVFIKPLSLCMRLFGNVLGAYVIMELIKIAVPVGLPVPFSFYFDIFDGLIQAYVFVFLTSLFIREACE